MNITPDRTTPASKHLQLMATCLCDAFFADAARATVEVLEYAGCEIEFPEGQTCCGQPAFNSGDWPSSRKVVRHCLEVFQGDKPVVVPSGSCAAMMFHGSLLEFENEPDLRKVDALSRRSWELMDYLVNGLGITSWPGKFPARVAFHQSCHSRGTPSGAATRQLLESIEGLELIPFGEAEQCCGFGGTFSVTFPHISAEMGRLKIDHILAQKPAYLASGDMGCMLHLGGMLDKSGHGQLQRVHVAQILHQALIQGGLLG